MIPEGWKEVEISEILERISNPIDVSEEQKYREIGIRSHGRGLFHKELVSGESLGRKRVFQVEPNCLVLNIVFAWEQAVAITTDAERFMVASHRFPMYKPKRNQCNIDYILNFFKTKKGKYLLELASPGGAGRNKTLGQSEFYKLKLLLPPYAEQNKIAEILSVWDEAISTTEKMLANTKNLKKALMQRLFSAKERLCGTDGQWSKKKISDIAVRIQRKPDGDIHPILTISSLKGFIKQEKKYAKYMAGESVKNYTLLKKGEFAYNKGNSKTFQFGCIFDLENYVSGLVPSVYVCFKLNSEVDHGYFKYLFESDFLKRQLRRLVNTGVRNDGLLNIKASDFMATVVPLPSLEEQQAIAEVMKTVTSQIKGLELKVEYLIKEKQALVQQLLTGKVRVKAKDIKAA